MTFQAAVRRTSCALFIVVIAVTAGCGSSEEGREDRTPRRVRALGQPDPSVGAGLAGDAEGIASVQLHATGDEVEPPVLSVDGQRTLTLAFDLLGNDARPLTVHFYHADREWRRDLSPSEYLETYHDDDILDYRPSQLSDVRFTHYQYSFPNNSIAFRVSGNYILRVSEQGNEDAVLFERPFLVTEQSIAADLLLDNVIVSNSALPAVQPTAVFTPRVESSSSAFDYSVCFVRDGRIASARCATDPSLMNQPALEFYLQPVSAFRPDGGDYVLDLSVLQPGGQLERIDQTSVPITVELAPDYVRFGADEFSDRLLGQSEIGGAVRDVGEPHTQAQYVETRFSLVTEGDRTLADPVYVVGAFNGWQMRESGRMTWDPDAARYTATLLVKQGRYEYRYTSPSARTRSTLSRSLPRSGVVFTAMVYYDDTRLQTDRLLSVVSSRSF